MDASLGIAHIPGGDLGTLLDHQNLPYLLLELIATHCFSITVLRHYAEFSM
jgi:hypothetical protein